jgi:hypothetical protein
MKQPQDPKKNRTRLVFEHESNSGGSIVIGLALAFAFLALGYVGAHPEQAIVIFVKVLAHIMQ